MDRILVTSSEATVLLQKVLVKYCASSQQELQAGHTLQEPYFTQWAKSIVGYLPDHTLCKGCILEPSQHCLLYSSQSSDTEAA